MPVRQALTGTLKNLTGTLKKMSNRSLPDSRHKPRNAGPIIVTSRETETFAAKYACSRRAVDIRWEGGCSSSLRIVLELAGIRGMHMIEALAIALATVAMGIPAMIVATALGSRLGFYW